MRQLPSCGYKDIYFNAQCLVPLQCRPGFHPPVLSSLHFKNSCSCSLAWLLLNYVQASMSATKKTCCFKKITDHKWLSLSVTAVFMTKL